MDRVIEVAHKGKWFEFLTRTESGYDVTVTDKIVIKEMFLLNVYQVFEGDFSDSGAVVDVGGNIGAFSIYAAALGAKKVYAFEPDSLNFEMLQQNIANNDLGAVIRPRKVGIAKGPGSVKLYQGQGASFVDGVKGLTPEAQRRLDTAPTEIVSTISLARAFSDADIHECDVLKVDCEGSEYNIFEAAKPTLLKKCKYITMEFHPANEVTFGKMIAKLSLTHNIHIIGRHDVGGQIYAKRY